MANPIELSNSASLEQQAFQVALELQRLELAIDPDDRPDRTDVTFDTEESTVTIGITLDTNLVVTNGNAVISATTYLTPPAPSTGG